MNFLIGEFKNNELDELAREVSLEENLDYQCKFLVCRKDNKIIGVAGVNFIKSPIPRFEHIIISPEYQKTKLGGILMKRTDRWLIDLGYKQYNAFIFYGKDLMRHYANKWGMIETTKGNKGSWFVKDLIPKKEREYEYARVG